MAKKYNQQSYTGSYSGSAQSMGFNPVKVVDETKKYQQRTKELNQPLEAEAKHLQRSYAVQTAQLSANKAKSDASFKAFQGLLSLTSSGLKFADQMAKQNELAALKAEEEAKKAAIEQEQSSFLFGEGETPRLDSAVDREAQQTAVASTIGGEASNLTDDPQLQEDIIAPTANAEAARGVTRISTYEAAARVGTDLNDFLISDAVVTLPDGRTIKARDAVTSPEIAAVAAAGIQQLTRGYGLESMDPQVVRETYLGSAKAAYQNAIAARSGQTREIAQDARTSVHLNAATTAVQTGAPMQQAYENLFNGIRSSNPTLTNTEINKQVRDHLINTARGMGLEGVAVLENLKGVQQRPGVKGTELGAGPYAADIDRAIRQARSNVVSDYSTSKGLAAIELENAQRQYNIDILNASTEEERMAINAQYESELAEAARAGVPGAYEQLMSAQSKDDRYDPLGMGRLMDMVSSGQPISREHVQQQIDSGVITAEQGAQVIKAAGSNLIEPAAAQLKSYQTPWRQQAAAKIRKELKFTDDPEASALYADDTLRALNRHMSRWVAENPDADATQINAEAERATDAILASRLQENAEGKPEYVFPPEAPAQPFTSPVTGRPARNLQHFTTTRLRAMGSSDLDIYNDNLLTEDEYRQAVTALQTGGAQSARVKAVAAAAGTTPRNLLYAQSVGKGIDLDAVLREQQTPETESRSQPTTIQQGAQYLHHTLGFSARGAAYLSANIMQESSWNGMRSWGQVLNDGTSRNGGLVSWASWSNDPARLGWVEARLGKPIEQATHTEQLQVMHDEMKQNYPGAYRVFNNPNATDAQLRRASYQYWGYGEEGNRFGSYLDQALASV